MTKSKTMPMRGTVHCPDCHVIVNVKAGAREGRCRQCRPHRQHSRRRRGEGPPELPKWVTQ